MILLSRRNALCLLATGTVALVLPQSSDAFGVATPNFGTQRITANAPQRYAAASDDAEGTTAAPEVQRAPSLNGKMVLPYKVMAPGLKGHSIPAIYAVLNSKYKRGSGDGWENCEYVGATRNLDKVLQAHFEAHGSGSVASIRALSFSFPQKDVMEEIASQWRQQVEASGGKSTDASWDVVAKLAEDEDRAGLVDLMEQTAFFDEDEDYDDDDDEWEDMDDAIVSPFAEPASETPSATDSAPQSEEILAFNRENVDKVLEEVRPYLISDGGNVAVDRVDEETKNVYLILEGACGSCASSTVTMQMGIERVLKENFEDLGEVIQVEDPAAEASKPTELTLEAVEEEVNRIKPAIVAMGGVVEIVSVDPSSGVVELKFQGFDKVKKGLELAILDVEFVNEVKWVD